PISIKLQNRTTNQTLDRPALTLTGVRLTGLMVKSFFWRTLDLGILTFADTLRHTVRRCNHEPNAGARQPRIPGEEQMDKPRRSPRRFGVPVVCLLAGLLLAATHGVSGGSEIRRSDAPRLVDLVREAQQSVDRLTAERDSLVTTIDTHHGGSPGADAALAAITNRSAKLAVDAGLD